MYRMRDAHETAARKETLKHPVTGEDVELGEHDRSLAEILQDKQEQERFLNKYVFERKPVEAQEIADALAGGTPLDPKQMKLLEAMRESYNLDRKRIELVSELLTGDELRRIASLDPRMKEVVGQVGPEAAAELMRAQLQDFALSDRRSFDRIVRAHKAMHDIGASKEAKNLDRELGALLAKYQIPEQKFFEATRSGAGAPETLENLRKLAAEEYGWFRKSVDFVSGNALSHRRGRRLVMNLQEQDALMRQCDTHRAVIGRFLRATLTPDVRMAIQKHLLEGGSLMKGVEQADTDTVKSVQDYRRIKEEANTLTARYAAYEKEECKRRKITDISKQPALRDTLKDEFAKREVEARKKYKGRGVFGTLLLLLFGSTPATKDDIKKLLP